MEKVLSGQFYALHPVSSLGDNFLYFIHQNGLVDSWCGFGVNCVDIKMQKFLQQQYTGFRFFFSFFLLT